MMDARVDLSMEASYGVDDSNNIAVKKKLKSQNKSIVEVTAKRSLDILASSCGLVVLFPVFLVTAIAILLEDGGPIFYTQIRIGKNKTPFHIYKFRSMVKNAENIHEELRKSYNDTEVSFKLKKDPRVTKVGHFIRKYNIDELPQLINIVKGDMSIVGPRPLPDYEYEEEQSRYGDIYSERYSVPQGLTCYWQLSNRSEIKFEERMQMDVEYARKWSFYGDLKMVVRTLAYTVLGRGGY